MSWAISLLRRSRKLTGENVNTPDLPKEICRAVPAGNGLLDLYNEIINHLNQYNHEPFFGYAKVVGFICLAIVGVMVFSGIVMLLWNSLFARTVPFPRHYLLAGPWGLLILTKLLFGGFRGRWSQRRPLEGIKMKQRWMNMTPEEREKFKTGLGPALPEALRTEADRSPMREPFSSEGPFSGEKKLLPQEILYKTLEASSPKDRH